MGIKGKGNQEAVNEGPVAQLPSVSRCTEPLAWPEGLRNALTLLREEWGARDPWGKEEETPHEGQCGNTGRQCLDEPGPASQNMEA